MRGPDKADVQFSDVKLAVFVDWIFEVVVEGSLEGKANECQMENNCPVEGEFGRQHSNSIFH